MTTEKEAEVNNLNIIIKNETKLPLKERLVLFIILINVSIMLNAYFDTLSLSSSENVNTRGTNLIFSLFIYSGILIGSSILLKVIDYINRKIVLIGSITVSLVLIMLFNIIHNIGFSLVNRLFFGISQSFIIAYLPIWVDQFGPKTWKTIMMSIVSSTPMLSGIIIYIFSERAVSQ